MPDADAVAVRREPIRAQLRAGWAEPGTRLGFWVHFTTPFPGGVFGLLWGFLGASAGGVAMGCTAAAGGGDD